MVQRVSVLLAAWTVTLVVLSGVTSATAIQATGQISATQVSAPSASTIDSGLLAAYLPDPLASSPADAQAVSFTLDAAQVRVDTYQYDPYFVTSAGSVGAPTPVQAESHPYGDARVESAPAKPGYRFSVVAPEGSATAHLVSDCGAMAPSGQQTFEAPVEVSHSAPPVSADVSQASQWTQCGAASMTVTGRFVVVVYGIDATLTTSNETVDLRSGDDQSSVSPLPPSGPAYVTHRRQQYLYVDSGALSFPLSRASDVAYLAAPQIATSGTLSFTNAQGELHQGSATEPIHAASLALAGDLHLSAVTSKSGKLQGTFTGQIDHADADGHTVQLTSTVSSASAAGSWLWATMGVAGAVLVPAGVAVSRRGAARRRRQVAARIELCDQLFEEGDYIAMRVVAADLVRRAPRNAEARLQLVRALDEVGTIDEAEEARATALELLGAAGLVEDVAALAFQGFSRALNRGSLPDALRWQRISIAANPRIRNEMVLHPAMQDFLGTLEAKAEVPWYSQP